MKKAVVIFLATGAYVGLSPVMPGTIGTLWGVLVAWFFSSNAATQVVLLVLVTALALVVSGPAERILARPDPSSVVIDEVAGFLVAFFLIPPTIFNLILVFLLFRFFDIVKPYPINLLDKKLKGGVGIVVDDLVAGVYANVCAHIILRVVR